MEAIVEKVWTKSKLLVKAMVIGALVLILQIPAYYVQHLVEEREQRQNEAIAEVSSKWAGRQNITGPVVVLPYIQRSADSLTRIAPVKHYAYFLPDELTIHSSVTPQERYRGIYKIMLYGSRINLSGTFNEARLEGLNIRSEDVLWNEAFIRLNIADTKGLNDELKLNWNNQLLTLSPMSSGGSGDDALSARLPLKSAEDMKNIHFSSDLSLSGTEQLLFTPVGKSTTVTMNSTWPHPSFTGSILPQSTQIKDSGFTATWKSLAHKRNFPQMWKDDEYLIGSQSAAQNSMSASAFGADIYMPVNNYQRTMRSVKYAALCILLTFAAFFIIDTTNKKSVHPLQYGLIGLALILFYTLLLSFSEYTGFNISYAIASCFTIGLIAWFVKGVLQSTRLSTIITVVLMLLYTYVFTILQLQDYALLLGSLGLFLTLAVIMHFSRKIQW
jgi:inner membrane protein